MLFKKEDLKLATVHVLHPPAPTPLDRQFAILMEAFGKCEMLFEKEHPGNPVGCGGMRINLNMLKALHGKEFDWAPPY